MEVRAFPKVKRTWELAQAQPGQAREPRVGRQPKGMPRPSEYEERVIHEEPRVGGWETKNFSQFLEGPVAAYRDSLS